MFIIPIILAPQIFKLVLAIMTTEDNGFARTLSIVFCFFKFDYLLHRKILSNFLGSTGTLLPCFL